MPSCLTRDRHIYIPGVTLAGEGWGYGYLLRLNHYRRRADALLHDSTYDLVHLDPYGSCVPHMDAAFAHTPHRGIVSMTATDTAALYSIYPAVTRRMYGATEAGGGGEAAAPPSGGKAARRDCWREIGARLLLAAAARAAARQVRPPDDSLLLATSPVRVRTRLADTRSCAATVWCRVAGSCRCRACRRSISFKWWCAWAGARALRIDPSSRSACCTTVRHADYAPSIRRPTAASAPPRVALAP